MATQRWQQMRALFDAAVETPPGQRKEYLRANCGDANLRREVEALLAEAAEEDTAIREVISGEAARIVAPQTPASIGPYTLLRELGQGGMGTVYLAERRGEFRQEVAVKVATRCQADHTLLARFRAERQILANLHHPNIAQVLDGGSTDDGTPYVVMEYVDGEPITVYCKRKRLSVDARLRLFRRACEAVHFAHQNLVVHRDIKPANLLVTPQGEPKLLDFGIAKLLDAEASGVDAIKTEAAAIMMTPAYASPEQIRGKSITTASDVYALGVLLYELLTGKRPFLSTESESYGLQKAICEDDPPRPSMLAKGLSRDLDAIVLKAMRKRPADRYASVEQLSADIGRHLNCYPVHARNRTWQYHTSRFLRRNRAFAPVAAAFILLIGAALAGLNFQARETASQRDRAVAALRQAESAQRLAEERRLAAERNELLAQDFSARAARAEIQAIEEATRARDEAAASGAVARFLEDLFRDADPMASNQRDVTAAGLLRRGAQRVKLELANEPAMRARLQDSIGLAYLAIGDSAEAETLIEESLATRRRLFGESHVETARSLHSMGKIFGNRGDYPNATASLERAISIFEAEGPSAELDAANALAKLADLALVRSAHLDANAAFQKVLLLSRKNPVEMQQPLRAALRGLANLASRQGRYADGEVLVRESLSLSRKIYGDSHPETAIDWGALGLVLREHGRFPEAAVALDNAAKIYMGSLGPDHPNLSSIYNNLATIAYALGDYATAERNFIEAHRIRSKASGPDEATSLRMLNNIGVVRFQQRDFDGALAIYSEVLERQRAVVGGETRDVADTLNNLGRTHLGKGELAPAEQFLRESLAIRRKVQGDDHPLVAVALDGLGILRRDQQDYEGALKLHEESLGIRQAKLGENHPVVSVPLLGLGYCHLMLGDPRAAEIHLRRALAIREAKLPAGHWEISEVRSVLGAALLKQGRMDDAEVLLVSAHLHLLKTQGAETSIVKQAEGWLLELRATRAAGQESGRHQAMHQAPD
ncbi:MAG: serine/threonine protein kinase [Bryobacterales bacterium]|nr:serine/threonine protein kinase [Bryobacterales bacterium]